jgi:formylglycine-generating enzyme required for sulfatase activity/serine/threonine protein kinase
MPAFCPPPPGTIFGGDFVIVRLLKEGGMGAVYVAEQRSTGAMRALKVMHPQYVENEAMRRRFEQEARAGARIQSDYVVDVVAAGVDPASGMPWIAMELLEGEDLGDHVARVSKLPPGEALGVFRMLCHAVAAAHDAGIVHRDLKPENVFLARSRRPGEAFTLKVLDFGIARAAAADARATGTAALGTPLWMAPEQTSRGPVIGPPTDVWALGLIAFYVLTGSWYWRTAHLESPSITEFLQELALGSLDPASVRAADLGLGSLPDGFDEWFAKCVAREASSRFEGARPAFAALEPILAAAAMPGGAGLAAHGTMPVDEPAPAMAVVDAGARPARPFFVGTATEKALARGEPARPLAPLPPLPSPPVVTAPATAITGDATGSASGKPRRWPFVALAALAVAGGAAWLWSSRRTEPASSAIAALPSAAASPATTPSSSAPAVPDEVAKAAAMEVTRESPMVSLAGTVFTLGYDAGAIDERPVHDVSFPTFFMQIDEVTVAQYARCVAVGRCTPAGTDEYCNAGHAGREHNPINCVSEPQAEAYCAWLRRRLPTEEEWEYAASGKAKRLYAWGNTPPAGRICSGRPDAGTCDVGSFDGGATPEGLRDMTGNVWEWTTSDYCFYDQSIRCAHDQKVARGGGWFSADPNVVRTQVRQGYAPATHSANVGFRCARSL